MDVLTQEQRSRNMRAIKSTGSKIEKILAKAMWADGLRYRKNDKAVFGKPDFTFRGVKLAIFCDGEFWHGKNWEVKKKKILTNPQFWHNKIERNIQRDHQVNFHLVESGWVVLRFWEKEIKKNPDVCVATIKSTIELIKKSRSGKNMKNL